MLTISITCTASGSAGKPATQLVPLLEALLQHGANVDAADEQGTTALHQAAKSSPCAVVEALLAHHATTNQQDKVLHTTLPSSFSLPSLLLLPPSNPPCQASPPPSRTALLVHQAAINQQGQQVQYQASSPVSS